MCINVCNIRVPIYYIYIYVCIFYKEKYYSLLISFLWFSNTRRKLYKLRKNNSVLYICLLEDTNNIINIKMYKLVNIIGMKNENLYKMNENFICFLLYTW